MTPARPSRSTAPLAAYVLHQHDWSESSLILELFTRERGRVAVAAKGAKRPYSQLRSVLMPFQRLHITLGKAAADEAAELQTLRAAEWAGGTPMPGGAAIFSGYYLNELLLKLLARQDPHASLFDAYADTLPLLGSANDTVTQAALRAFELLLLREIGVLPDLASVTATLQPLQAERRYSLLPDAGLAEQRHAEHAMTGTQWGRLNDALALGHGAALVGACAEAVLPLRGMLRALLHYHLGSPTLRTRRVLADVQRWVDTATPP